MSWWKFWERKEKHQKQKLSGMALRMFNKEKVICSTCGDEYEANYTRCIRCGAPTVMNLEVKDIMAEELKDGR